MVGFIHFSDTLRKASKNKLLQIVNLLDIVSKGTKKELYLRIISELGIIYDKNNVIREQCFIKANKTTLIVDEDSNGVVRYQLHYKKEDAVRIKAVPGYKKYFWITETGVLVSKRTKTILSQTLSKTGYWIHSSMIGGRKGKSVCFKIHRLVAFALFRILKINHL